MSSESTFEPPHAPQRVVTITPRTLWLAAAIAASFVVGAFVLVKALDAFILLFVGIILAEGIRPLMNWLGRWRIPRPLAVILIYLALFAGLAILGWLLVTPLTAQLVSFVDAVPQQAERLQQEVQQIQQRAGQGSLVGQALSNLGTQAGNLAGQVAPLLLSVPLGMLNILFDAILVLVVAFMWLNSVDGLKPFVLDLLPEAQQDEAGDILHEMGERIGGYLRGVVFNSLVIGAISTAGLLLLGVPYPLLLGTFAGMTEAIPMIGPFFGGGAAALVALASEGPLKAGETLLLYAAIQQIEGNTLVPLVMNRTVKLNPLAVLLGLIVGTALFGLIGGVLSVPLTVVLEVVVIRVLAPLARHASGRADRPELGEEAARAEDSDRDRARDAASERWGERTPAAT